MIKGEVFVELHERPIFVFWETTKACLLKCKHRRAEAYPHRAPDELKTTEGFKFMEELATLRPPPVLILSGGDPLMREDIWELVDNANYLGIPVGLSLASTE